MALVPNVEAFLLVGGKSSRMGRDKAFLELNGAPLIQRTANLLAPLIAKTTLVISASQPANNTNPYSTFELPTLADRWPSAGPLGGIATASLDRTNFMVFDSRVRHAVPNKRVANISTKPNTRSAGTN